MCEACRASLIGRSTLPLLAGGVTGRRDGHLETAECHAWHSFHTTYQEDEMSEKRWAVFTEDGLVICFATEAEALCQANELLKGMKEALRPHGHCTITQIFLAKIQAASKIVSSFELVNVPESTEGE